MKSVKTYLQEVKKGNVKVEETVKDILDEAKKINKNYNYFNTFSNQALKRAKEIDKEIKSKKAKGKLLGLPISVKDCICVKDLESTAGSKILKTYKPVFNSTVVQRAEDEGAIVIGKTSQDEFGFGSFSVNTGIDFNIPKNPFDKDRVTGGSSGGAAGFTQITKYPHLALAESTGGSIACPASFCGVSGLTPTYGLVSRYGLIDYANSLDKIGTMSKNVEDSFLLLDVIKGHDKKDSTSLKQELKPEKKIKRIGLIGMQEGVDERIKDLILKRADSLEIEFSEITLPLNEEYGIATYYLIATSEASTNLAKFCGMRYGYQEEVKDNFNEYFSKIRSKAFSKEAKRRIILGTFARMAGFRNKYYLKAMKTRTLLIQEYQKAFKTYDILISPTMPVLPLKFSEIKDLTPLQNYMIDILTVGPNLAGLPHISINAGFIDNLPVGLMLTSNYLEENSLLEISKSLDNQTKTQN